jgi:hypothetical protein
MGLGLERRVRELENSLGCPKPEHRAGVLFFGEELSAEDQARIDSIGSCQKCSNRQLIIFQTNVPEDDD